MTERPILFSGPMVRAILAEEKTQTRRAVRPQPDPKLDYTKGRTVERFRCVGLVPPGKAGLPWWQVEDARGPINAFRQGAESVMAEIGCPYGQPGDRLWVREAWTADFDWPSGPGEERIRWWHQVPAAFRGLRNVQYTYYRADGSAWHCDEAGAYCPAHEDDPLARRDDDTEDGEAPIRWRPSIHMPRWASRLLLEVTAVRVERLQAITEDDAIGEGCGFDGDPIGDDDAEVFDRTPRGHFAQRWDSLNAKRGYGWKSNPWVWVLEFKSVPLRAAREGGDK